MKSVPQNQFISIQIRLRERLILSWKKRIDNLRLQTTEKKTTDRRNSNNWIEHGKYKRTKQSK